MSQWGRRSRLLVALLIVLAGASTGVIAQQTGKKAVGASADDQEFARLVKEWTTRPEFSSPLVDHLPKVPGLGPGEAVGGGPLNTLLGEFGVADFSDFRDVKTRPTKQPNVAHSHIAQMFAGYDVHPIHSILVPMRRSTILGP